MRNETKMRKGGKKTIGIIGGMGPLATCDLMEKIIARTGAENDQENLHLVVDCNTEIPDRTEAILNQGESPVPQLVRSGIKLQGMGADVLVMSCNTAHYFYDCVIPYLDIPLLHMIRETGSYLRGQGVRRAGLLATDGTVRSRVYQEALEQVGISPLIPDAAGQRSVMDLIYHGVKAGRREYDTQDFRRTVERLLGQGAERLILGCTELPLAVKWYGLSYPAADPTEVLAEAAIRYCRTGQK